jgi:hypothetical protein
MDDGVMFTKDEVDNNLLMDMVARGKVQTPDTGMAERETRTRVTVEAAESPLPQEWQADDKDAVAPHLILLVDATNTFNSESKQGML